MSEKEEWVPRCPSTGWPTRDRDGNRHVHRDDDETPCYGSLGKILQLLPAPGWRAVWADEEKGKVTLWNEPLVAFALVEMCNGEQEVAPLHAIDSTAYIERADTDKNFIGLVPPGENVEMHRASAERFVERKREQAAKRKAGEKQP